MNRSPRILSSSLTLIISLFLVTFGGHASAAKNRVSKDSLPWYEIEVLVFANTEQKGLDTETWPHNSPMKHFEQVISLDFPGGGARADLPDFATLDTVTAAAAGAEKKVNLPEPFAFVPANEFRLANFARKILNSQRYEPLLHIAWRQPTQSPKTAIPVFVYSGMDNQQNVAQIGMQNDVMGPQSPRLYGLIRMSVSRYLHVEPDLHLRSPVVQQEYILEQPEPGFFSSSSEPVEKLINRNMLLDFRLNESRRMRSKEIHFYDHPMFGVIVLVTPYDVIS